MGYSIYIGEPEVEFINDDWNDGELIADINIPEVKLLEAPTFPNDPLSAKNNGRHPSYTGWHDFCRITGLIDLFYDEEKGLIRKHPGCFRVEVKHLNEVRDALQNFLNKNPDAVPAFGADPLCKNNDPVPANADGNLARLIWLEFWMSWALDYCKVPAISNS